LGKLWIAAGGGAAGDAGPGSHFPLTLPQRRLKLILSTPEVSEALDELDSGKVEARLVFDLR
jgi:hypothetical protein